MTERDKVESGNGYRVLTEEFADQVNKTAGSFADNEFIHQLACWEGHANGNNSDMPPEAWREFMRGLDTDVRAQLIRMVNRANQQGIETFG